MITGAALLTALVIFVARVCDVSLGTIRHVMVIRGRKMIAFSIAFFEALIWVYAVSRVLSGISDPLTSFAFALGFASGTYVGMTIEGFFKIGEQVVRVFTREGERVASLLREQGFRVTIMDGRGRDGAVQLLFVQVKRRLSYKVAKLAREMDCNCFIVFDDISAVHPPDGGAIRK